ncbi:hypothetical protein I4Q36_06860 [Tuanshanicoccus lijuaniae]|uniref:hypothetical protein n=1 Tax=Aerococcaceae bacterium zg-1292 TaxID=2774330 RepID=UPI0019369B4C|nr:hypothetical protein [Aerococcaceae bacterium zg-1292]QQA38224.1 hypothetical protein I4Q36_06860 [Aerococcaceae bacterium zg-1292]
MSDIPAKNMQTWIEWAYPVFRDYIISGKTADSVGRELVDRIIPQDNTMIAHLMNITSVRILVSYNPRVDDIKLFADYIMDIGNMKIRFSKYIDFMVNYLLDAQLDFVIYFPIETVLMAGKEKYLNHLLNNIEHTASKILY